jgi:hypothetical protein
MILSDYVKQVIDNSHSDIIEIEVGVFPMDGEIIVDEGDFPNSPSINRLKFTVKKPVLCENTNKFQVEDKYKMKVPP